MPGYDRTGPQGQGAMTGRGMGRCGGQGRGYGRGTDPGRGYGLGRGYNYYREDSNIRPIDTTENFSVGDVERVVGDISDLVSRLGKFLSQYKKKDKSGD